MLILGTVLSVLLVAAYAGEERRPVPAPNEYGALVASRLGGVWVLGEEHTKRLDGSAAILSLTFSPDADIRLGGKLKEAFEPKNVRQTGKVKIVRRQDLVVRAKPLELPYILSEERGLLRISAFGVPTLMPDPPNLPNSNASIILVPAKDKQNGLLFVGGNLAAMTGFSVHGPFAVYERQNK